MMKFRHLLTLFVASALAAVLQASILSSFDAESTYALEADTPTDAALVNIPFNAELDRPTVRPASVEQSDNPHEGARAVVGRDDREPVLTRSFPWLAVGRLEWQYEGEPVQTCTATLIGPDTVLSNSHCLLLPYREDGKETDIFIDANRYARLKASGKEVPQLVFKPGMINGIAKDESAIAHYKTGWTVDNFDPAEDWSVMTLEVPLGEKYGYLGWRKLDLSDDAILALLAEKSQVIGYALDFPTEELRAFGEVGTTAGVDSSCSILGISQSGDLKDTIVHDCDTNSGTSGGPILSKFDDGQYYIIGLHARRIPLSKMVRLPNGIRTRVVNGGVEVSRWAD